MSILIRAAAAYLVLLAAVVALSRYPQKVCKQSGGVPSV